MNCWFIESVSAWARSRAKTSVPPPGDEGTTSLTGLDGQMSCAEAKPAATVTATANTVCSSDFISADPSTLEPRAVFSPHVAIDDVHRPFARQHAAHFVGRPGLQADHRLLAVPGDVRRDDDVVTAAQRMRIGKGLGIGGVERAAGDTLRVQRAPPRVGVH